MNSLTLIFLWQNKSDSLNIRKKSADGIIEKFLLFKPFRVDSNLGINTKKYLTMRADTLLGFSSGIKPIHEAKGNYTCISVDADIVHENGLLLPSTLAIALPSTFLVPFNLLSINDPTLLPSTSSTPGFVPTPDLLYNSASFLQNAWTFTFVRH